MKHLTQNEIDQIVLKLENNPDFDLKDYISNCDYCSKRIEEALLFNVNLSNFLKSDASPKLKAFIKELRAKNKETYIAYPITPAFDLPRNPSQ